MALVPHVFMYQIQCPIIRPGCLVQGSMKNISFTNAGAPVTFTSWCLILCFFFPSPFLCSLFSQSKNFLEKYCRHISPSPSKSTLPLACTRVLTLYCRILELRDNLEFYYTLSHNAGRQWTSDFNFF